MSLSLLFCDLETDCCLHGTGECLESASIRQYRSVQHQLPLLALYWQTEQPWKSHKEWLVPGPAKVFVAYVLIACHWKFAMLRTLWGIFGPGVGKSFCFTKDHATGPCRHPSVHTMCCLWVRMEISHCWKDTRVASFFLSLGFHGTGIGFYPQL